MLESGTETVRRDRVRMLARLMNRQNELPVPLTGKDPVLFRDSGFR